MEQKCKYKVSIIIPVYNVEYYVSGCIESCLKQDIPHDQYEIIIVNDGSTDKSLQIINQYAEKYLNILIVSQENAGLSVARNVGLQYSSGEYVWFVDSDDKIQENCLSEILDTINDSDMIAFGFDELLKDQVVDSYIYSNENILQSGKDFIISRNGNFLHGAPFYMYKRSFLLNNALSFCPGIFHEDSEFTPRALCMATTIVQSNQRYYKRFVRGNSITRRINVKRAYDLCFVVNSLNKFILTTVNDKTLRKSLQRLLPLLLNTALNVVVDSSEDEKRRYTHYFNKERYYKYFLSSGVFKYFIEGLMFSLFRNPVIIYNFFKR